MAGKKREKVRDEDVTGLKYFDKLQPLLKRLHEVGCQRDKAGNPVSIVSQPLRYASAG